MLKPRQEEIRAKGFNLIRAGAQQEPREFNFFEGDYSKIRVGVRQLDDAIINLGSYKKINSNYGDK